MGIGDWGLGIGDWGLGPIPNPHLIEKKIKSKFNKISFSIIKFLINLNRLFNYL